ncbi:MAG TPA: HAD family hydrolase [Patescibacteria group bacterium]|nr:HAD family hydrolase [Patescibacteria group bacterium]
MKLYEAIVFDLGGTLIEYAGKFDSWPDLEKPGMRAAHAYLRQEGVPVPPVSQFEAVGIELLPGYWERAKMGIRNLTVPILLACILDQFEGNLPENSLLEGAARKYEKTICAGAEPIPYSRELLAQLKAAGYRLGLISNTMFSGQAHLDDLMKFGMLSYFDATLFSADSNMWKPSPDPFLQLMSELNSGTATTLFVGDDPGADVAGARSAGIDVVHFASNDRFPPLHGVLPDATIHALVELPGVLAI